ncbi:MAG: VIT1/CCC1 transporter family protein, partial [Actinoplanes sp.]
MAWELTARDAFAAHADVELHLDPGGLTNPWHAAGASAVAFTVGFLLPLVAILLPPPPARVAVTFVVVVAALAATGYLSIARPG